MSDYIYLGDHSAQISHSIGLSCHHCKVTWNGCAAACCCPKCGTMKGYHEDDADKCYCVKCRTADFKNITKLLGQKIYEDRYGWQGGVWSAVSDSAKIVWYEKAQEYINMIRKHD